MSCDVLGFAFYSLFYKDFIGVSLMHHGLISKVTNRCSLILKQRFILYYCYLFLRHSLNDGNVIGVETLFQ